MSEPNPILPTNKVNYEEKCKTWNILRLDSDDSSDTSLETSDEESCIEENPLSPKTAKGKRLQRF
jgi:hypothetical protein